MLSFRVPVIVEGKYDKIRIVQVVDAPVITTDGFGIFNKTEKTALIRRLGQNGVILLCDSDGGGTVIRSFLKGILPPEKVYDLYIPQVAGKEKRKRKGGKAGFLGVEGIDNATLTALFARLAERHPEIVAHRDTAHPAVPEKDVVDNLVSTVDNSLSTMDNAHDTVGNAIAESSIPVVNTTAHNGDTSVSGLAFTSNINVSTTYGIAEGEKKGSGEFSTGSVSGTDEKPISKTDFFLYGLTGGENAAARRDILCRHLALPVGMTPNALLAALNILYRRTDFLALCDTLFAETM